MPYILRIDSSSRIEDSLSRRVADMIVNELQQSRPDLSVIQRDLIDVSIAHISNETIAGFYTPKLEHSDAMKSATQLSDELISELKGAEAVVISAPMYNFGVPSALKAWIDQIVRINETFSFDGESFGGLVPIKQAYLALAYGAGGYVDGGPFAAMNFLEPYLVSLMGFLGVESTKVFRIEGTTGDADQLANSMETLERNISDSLTLAAQ